MTVEATKRQILLYDHAASMLRAIGDLLTPENLPPEEETAAETNENILEAD